MSRRATRLWYRAKVTEFYRPYAAYSKVLLTEIVETETGKAQRSYDWTILTNSAWSANLRVGQIIEFEATTLMTYMKHLRVVGGEAFGPTAAEFKATKPRRKGDRVRAPEGGSADYADSVGVSTIHAPPSTRAPAREPVRTEARIAREATRLSQAEFADVIGVPVSTVRNWEQARTKPDAASRALLRIIAEEPQVAMRVLGQHKTEDQF